MLNECACLCICVELFVLCFRSSFLVSRVSVSTFILLMLFARFSAFTAPGIPVTVAMWASTQPESFYDASSAWYTLLTKVFLFLHVFVLYCCTFRMYNLKYMYALIECCFRLSIQPTANSVFIV